MHTPRERQPCPKVLAVSLDEREEGFMSPFCSWGTEMQRVKISTEPKSIRSPNPVDFQRDLGSYMPVPFEEGT